MQGECPSSGLSLEVDKGFLEYEVIAGFRVWQLAFMAAFAILCIVIVLCCIFRCRIPRTKQEIEADCARKKVTKQFSLHLRKIPVDKMELEKVLPEVITLEHHRVLKGIKEEKMTFFQKLKKALFSKEDDESSSSSGDDIEAADKEVVDETTKDASGDKTTDKESIKNPDDDIVLEEATEGKKGKVRSGHHEQLMSAIQKLNRIRAVQQQLQAFQKEKKEQSSRESLNQPDQSPKETHAESSPSLKKSKESKESKESRHISRHPSKTGSKEDPDKKKQRSSSKEESIKSRQQSKGDSKEGHSSSKKTSVLLKPEKKGDDVRSHSLESSGIPRPDDDSSGGSGSFKAAFLSKQKTCPILDTTDIVRKDLTYSTFKQASSRQQSPKQRKEKKQSPKQQKHSKQTISEDVDVETLKQVREKREKRMSRQIELTDKDIEVISSLHPGRRPPSGQLPTPPSPRVSARGTQYPSDAVLYEEIGPPSRTASRPSSQEESHHHRSRHHHPQQSQTHRSQEESKSAEHEEERTKF